MVLKGLKLVCKGKEVEDDKGGWQRRMVKLARLPKSAEVGMRDDAEVTGSGAP